MSVIEARGLTIGYGATVVRTGIDLSLKSGEITCLLGPNGVGKTTLFKTLLGLLPPLAGDVLVDGRPMLGLSRRDIARSIAYVPQIQPVEAAYSILDLVVMGRSAHLGLFEQPSSSDVDLARAALMDLGIEALADRVVPQVSGGQRQLALIARALVQQARVIIMDEPTASLDLFNRQLVLDRIRAVAQRGIGVLVSTHDPGQAFDLADHAAILPPGRRLVSGSVREVLTSERLSDLFGLDLIVEVTPSGRSVVSPRRQR